jgi:hypothetical protein
MMGVSLFCQSQFRIFSNPSVTGGKNLQKMFIPYTSFPDPLIKSEGMLVRGIQRAYYAEYEKSGYSGQAGV